MQVLNAARGTNNPGGYPPSGMGMGPNQDPGVHMPQQRYSTSHQHGGYPPSSNPGHNTKSNGYSSMQMGPGGGMPGPMQGSTSHYGSGHHGSYSQGQGSYHSQNQQHSNMPHYQPASSPTNMGGEHSNPEYYRERSQPQQQQQQQQQMNHNHHQQSPQHQQQLHQGHADLSRRQSISFEQRLAVLESQVFSLRQQNQLLMKYMNTSDAKIVELHNDLAKLQTKYDALESSSRQRGAAALSDRSAASAGSTAASSAANQERRVPSAGRRAGQIPSKTVLTYDNIDGRSEHDEMLHEQASASEAANRPLPSRSTVSKQAPKPEWQSVVSSEVDNNNADGFGDPPPIPASKKNLLLRTNKIRQAQARQADNAPPPSAIPQPNYAHQQQKRISSAGSTSNDHGKGRTAVKSETIGRVDTSNNYGGGYGARGSNYEDESEDHDNFQERELESKNGFESSASGGHNRRGSVDVTELDPFGGPEEDLEECPDCGRKMRTKALESHMRLKVCTKVRKQFDVKKMRMQGVLSESEIRQVQKKETHAEPAKQSKKSTWKQQHEQFIESIRYGKVVSQAQKDGVDIRTLPPPPQNAALDDRVECPYCSRKFAEQVADRHIPHCKNAKSRAAPPPRRR